jgi:transposase
MVEAMDLPYAHRARIEDAADAYKSLLVIERRFRSLESVQIEISPMEQVLAAEPLPLAPPGQ